MKRILTAAVLLAGLSSGAHAADYYIDGYQGSCRSGAGAEGIISVGDGQFSLTESHYVRKSGLTRSPDGWSQATYEMMSEGEAYGSETVRLRVTDAAVVIELGGRRFSGTRCP